MLDLLPGLDVFVLSSHYGGLPVSILEAMATALPVVASAVGGLPETISDGIEGWLVEGGELRLLGQRLGWLLSHPNEAREMGQRARLRGSQEASIKRLAREVVAV